MDSGARGRRRTGRVGVPADRRSLRVQAGQGCRRVLDVVATRGRNRDHRRKLGLYAPEATIAAAMERARETEERRAKQRVTNQASRDKAEDRYRNELADAVRTWLDFAPRVRTARGRDRRGRR